MKYVECIIEIPYVGCDNESFIVGFHDDTTEDQIALICNPIIDRMCAEMSGWGEISMEEADKGGGVYEIYTKEDTENAEREELAKSPRPLIVENFEDMGGKLNEIKPLPKIKPCPWCSKNKAELQGSFTWVVEVPCFVQCMNKRCGACGPMRTTDAAAMKAWNKGT